MKDSKIESLKKRTFADTVGCIVMAVVTFGIAILEFWEYFTADGVFPELIANAVYSLVICSALVIVSFIFFEIRKNGKPFSKGIIVKMRILAGLFMIGAFLPNMIAAIISSNGNVIVIELINSKTVLVANIGVIIGILSEIFVYGHQLQDDMDSIA